MLLETLDLKTNDVLIYSQNQFNFNDNFKVIYKNEKIKRPHRISYFEVCNYIKDPTPKNLIIYRLLTNVQNLDAYSTKYGYFIKIDDKVELIYFDPIFAIKDLRHLQFDFDPARFRFKIQQVGLTSITRWEKEPNFAEVYSFDLKAVEAQNQNDKIFADAIFALDPYFVDDENIPSEDIINKNNSIVETDMKKNTVPDLKKITEEKSALIDRAKELRNFSKPKTPASDEIHILREEIISLLRQALVMPENHVEDFKKDEKHQKKNEIDQVESGSVQNISLLDLFKTTYKSDHLDNRKKQNIILKFDEF